MKRQIKYIDKNNGVFGCLAKGNFKFYYLTKSNIRKFMDYLDVGIFVSFKPTNKTKSINGKKCYRVDTITKIEKIKRKANKILYSLTNIRNQIYNVLTSFDYYLFVDFEMSMPPYYKVDNFVAEIIQVGYVLTDSNLNPIKTNSYYLKPTYYKNVSKRTINFLRVAKTHFNNANPYNFFYDDFKQMILKYNPKLIVWGKNDYLILKRSYQINNEKSLTTHNSFINLLQVIKNYYNLYNDIGLAASYKKWVKKDYIQTHDALADAKVMKEIFKAFKIQMETDIKKAFRNF